MLTRFAVLLFAALVAVSAALGPAVAGLDRAAWIVVVVTLAALVVVGAIGSALAYLGDRDREAARHRAEFIAALRARRQPRDADKAP